MEIRSAAVIENFGFVPTEREDAYKGLRLAQKVLEDNGYAVTPVEQTDEYSFAGLTHLLTPVEQE